MAPKLKANGNMYRFIDPCESREQRLVRRTVGTIFYLVGSKEASSGEQGSKYIRCYQLHVVSSQFGGWEGMETQEPDTEARRVEARAKAVALVILSPPSLISKVAWVHADTSSKLMLIIPHNIAVSYL